MSESENVDRDEIEKFDALAHRWWDPNGDFKPLHDINPKRVQYIAERSDLNSGPVVDIGCGGGILTEALASLGADVTGVDMAGKALSVARLHALESGVDVTYLEGTAEALAQSHAEHFHTVTCLEMLEHVTSYASTIAACAAVTAPGGNLFFSTINRNPKAYALLILGAEYVLNLLPRGTHDYAKFIKPSELSAAIRAAGLDVVDISGMTYNPFTRTSAVGRDVDANYIVHATKPLNDNLQRRNSMNELLDKIETSYPALASAAADWRYQPEPGLLAGRNILVTGAGAGIGAAAAKSFACYGANVILLGRSRKPLEDVFDWIEQHTNTQAVIVPCDLELLDAGATHALHAAISENYGILHGLLHNASRLGPKVPLEHYPIEEWLRVMQTNVNAPFILTHTLFDLLDAADEACVINTSSSVGRQGRAYWGAYAVSKFATEGFSQVLADETESAGRIRVYSVNPGGTRTAMRKAAYPLEDPATLPSPEQHMDLYLYLMAGSRSGKTLPATGAQLDARTWECQ